MKIGLVMALEEEAAPIINALGLTKTSDRTYEGKAGDNDVCLRLAWMGQVNAQNAAWQLIGEGVQALANVGTCGDLGDHGIGSLPVCLQGFRHRSDSTVANSSAYRIIIEFDPVSCHLSPRSHLIQGR